MAKVAFTYLGPGPASVEVADSVTPRSTVGALFFWPDSAKMITEAELAYMQSGPVGSPRYAIAQRAVYGVARDVLVLAPESEEVGEGKRGDDGLVVETEGLDPTEGFGYSVVALVT